MRKSAAISMGFGVLFAVLSCFELSWGQPTMLMVVRGIDGALYKKTCDEVSCSSWIQIPGKLRDAPTVTWDDMALEWVIVGVNASNNIYIGTFDMYGNFNNDWHQVPGASPVGAGLSGRGARGFSGRVAIVAPSGGNFTNPATAMTNLSSWCPSRSETNPCLLKIMPGVYNIGSTIVTMQPYVDIEGSGENVTKITGNITHNLSYNGVVIGASFSEIRFLTIENTNATGEYAAAIFNPSSSPKITNVTAVSSSTGTTHNYAIINYFGSPILMNVKAVGANASQFNRAIHSDFGASPSMTNVVAQAFGGNYADAIRNQNSHAYIKNVTAVAYSASIGNYALSNGPGSYSVEVVDSVLNGTTKAIINESGVTTYVAHTQVAGGVNNSGVLKCIGSYTGSYSPLNATCE
jgi:hypothetical protein